NIVQDGLFITTNIAYATNGMTYIGSTVVSNGTLTLAGQVTLTNSTPIYVAGSSAVLDARLAGFLSTDNATFTNLVTNGVVEVVAGEAFGGVGTIKASNLV